MGFLDNLESNLKSLEGNNERETAGQERQRRHDEKARALAAAPHATALKQSPFVNDLLMQSIRIGHGMRVKVNMAWVGSTLRLDARGSRLELRPTPDGIEADVIPEGAAEPAESLPVDLTNSPEPLAERWMAQVRESIEAAKAAVAVVDDEA